MSAAPVPASSCANCGAPLHGAFCSACGQEAKPLDPPARHVAGELAQELFDVDSRYLRSFRRLFFSPGFLTREHFEGRRVPWLSPLKLYLLTSVACFAMLLAVGDDGGVKGLTVKGDVRDVGFASLDDLKTAIDEARAAWMPRVMFALVPFVAWVVSLVRRRSGQHYPAHLVFALHLYAAGFGARALAGAAGWAFPRAADVLSSAVGIYSLAYMFLAFRRAYGIGSGRAFADTAVVTLASWLAFVAGTLAIIGVTVLRAWIRAKYGV